ncbi:MAG: phosphotransferase family protein [Desulfomonilia bacterium]
MTGLKITKGRNLLSLFALDSDSPILIMGEGLGAWKGVFPQARYCTTIHSIPDEPVKYDLVLLDGSSAGSAGELVQVLVQIKQRMSGQGALILLARNRFSFERMKGLIKPMALNRDEHTYSYSQIMNAATSASFPYLCAFLPFSGNDAAQGIDEMVAPGSRFLEIPHHAHFLMKRIHSMGKYHLVHDRFAVLCMQRALLQNALFERIRTALGECGIPGGASLHLERVDIRDRGALVLFIKETNTCNHFIARVVHGQEIKTIIRKNHYFLQWLQQNNNVPDAVKTKIPNPLAELSFQENHVFIESLMPGILAWKANRKSLMSRIFEDSMQFILDLMIATSQNVSLDETSLDDLFREDEYRVNESEWCPDGFKKIFNQKLALIKRMAADQDMWLAASHGDYGYGNILVDPRDGRLLGVIDWDTGRKQEFAGVDIMNLMIQKTRTEQNAGFFQAVEYLLSPHLVSGCPPMCLIA